MDPVLVGVVVVGLMVALVVADRVVARLPPRPPRARAPRSGGSGGPGFGEIVEIFHPAARHVEEERQRLEADRVEDAGGEWPGIDLDGGTATLTRTGDDEPRRGT